MATFGNTATPSSGFFFDDRGSIQFGSIISSSFPGGYITQINIYIAGDGASATVKYGIWGTGGSLLWSSAGHSIAGGSRSIGGQAWQSNGVTGNPGDPGLYLAAGSNLRLGIWTSGNVVWTFGSSGSVDYDDARADITSFAGNGTDGSGAFGVYLDYTPYNGNGHVKRAGAFTTGFYKVDRAGSQSQGNAYVMRNGLFVKGS